MTITTGIRQAIHSSQPVEQIMTAQVCPVETVDNAPGGVETFPWVTLPPMEYWRYSFDETTRPMARATLTLPAQAFDWSTLYPHLRATRSYLRLIGGYRMAAEATTYTEQLAILVIESVSEQTDQGGRRTITLECASDEVLIADDVIAPGHALVEPDPITGRTVSNVWYQMAEDGGISHLAGVLRQSFTEPSTFQNDVDSCFLEQGDSLIEFLYGLADIANGWIHSNQRTDSRGGFVIQPRVGIDPTPRAWLTTTPTMALDQTVDPIVISQTITHGLDEFASIVDVVAKSKSQEWVGYKPTPARRFTAPPTYTPLRRQATSEISLTSGSTIPPTWPAGLALASRMSQRSVLVELTARNCFWLRPRDTVKTDAGPLLVRSVSYTSDGLMTLLARPQ